MKRLLALIFFAALSCSPSQEPDQKGPTDSPGAQWVKGRDALMSRTEVAAATVGHRIFVSGGFVEGGTVADVEVYDADREEFSRGTPLPLAVNHATSASDGQSVFVLGGYAGPDLSNPTARAFVLKGTDWTEIEDMPEPRAAGGAAFAGGKIYVVGGVGPSGLADSTLIYDVALGRWSKGAGLLEPREHLGVAAFEGKVYAVGGRAPSNLGDAEVYDADRRQWRALPKMPTPRGGIAAASTANGFIVAPGGEAEKTFEEVEAFDVRSSKWVSLRGLPTPRHGLGVAAVGNVVFVIEGGPRPGFAFSNSNEFIDLSSLR